MKLTHTLPYSFSLLAGLLTTLLLAQTTTAPSSQPGTTTSALIAHYPLAGDAVDLTRLSPDGRIRDATPTTDRFNRKNHALAFNGTTSEVILAPSPKLSPSAFTISIWFKPALPDSTKPWIDVTDGNGKFRDPIVGQDDGFSIRAFQLWLNPSRQLIWHRLGEYSSAWTKKTALKPDVWYHAAVTFDGEQHALYLNGKLEHQVDGILKISHEEPIYLGSKGAGTLKRAFFTGSLSDLRFYNRTLTPEEITALYQATP